MFARYLIPALLPLEVSRVIYLDQDVVVQGDLAELWAIDLEGKPLAAAREYHTYLFSSKLTNPGPPGLCRPTALVSSLPVLPLIDPDDYHSGANNLS